MELKQIIYKIIYQRQINYVVRNLLLILRFILPKHFLLPPAGNLKINLDFGKVKLATNQTSYLTQLLFWEGYKNFEY